MGSILSVIRSVRRGEEKRRVVVTSAMTGEELCEVSAWGADPLAEVLRAAEVDAGEKTRPGVAIFQGRVLPLHATLRVSGIVDGARLALLRSSLPWVAVARRQSLEVWDMTGQRRVSSLPAPGLVAAAVAAASPVAVTVAENGAVVVYDLTSGERKQSFRSRLGRVASVVLSPDGRVAVLSSAARVVEQWCCETGESIRTWVSADALSAAVSENGVMVATSGQEGTARLLEAASGRCLSEMCDHDGPVNSVAFADGGRSLVTASSDGAVRVWEAPSGCCLDAVSLSAGSDEAGPLAAASMSPDGSAFLVRRTAGAELWSRCPCQRRERIAEGQRLTSAEFSRDGAYVVTASAESGGVAVWSAASGRRVQSIQGGGEGALCAGFVSI